MKPQSVFTRDLRVPRGLQPPLLLFLLLAGVMAVAQSTPSPFLIPFQGRLTNPQGVSYTNGQYTIIFNLYDQPVGGTVLWSETHQKIGVINGMVNVFLGSINPAISTVDFSQTRHLGITIDADGNPNTPDPEMVPRQMIIPAFWAKNSEKLNGYDWSSILIGGGNNPVAGQIAGSKIQTGGITSQQLGVGSVTAVQIAAGAVTSVHLAAGAVTSSAIANGTITSNQLAFHTITPDRIAPRIISTNVPVGGLAISESCGAFINGNGAIALNVSNLNVTIATQGRPVEISFISDGSTNMSNSYFSCPGPTTLNPTIYMVLVRDGIPIALEDAYVGGLNSNVRGIDVPPGSFKFLDYPPAGTHTYQVQIYSGQSSNDLYAYYIRMIAQEF